MTDLRLDRTALLARTDVSGRALCDALTATTDAWFAELFEEATAGASDVALAAVGGYGRGELSPGSDLDVLLLHGRGVDAPAIAERLWYPVWDTGLKLGHSVRTVKQAVHLAADDLDTATSLLDVRLLAGDRKLVDELAEKALAQWRKRAKRWLAEVARRVAERHAIAGEVAFLLEPDVKEGRGGLRDVHALGWAEAAQRVLLEGDDEALDGAYDVLLGVRVELHRLTGKTSDQLLLERQDDVASALGHRDADALMASVAEAARTIAWTSDETWDRIGSWLAGPVGGTVFPDRAVGLGLVLRERSLHLTADADPSSDPTLALRAGAAAAQAGVGIDRRSLDRLTAVPPLGDPWEPGAREALVALLGAGRQALPVLEALDQRRLLERALPEWTSVRCKPQRNAYHRFTVDRHLSEAAANAAALTSRVARPDLLLLGTLLHDIGKGFPGDHTDVGIDLVASIGARMGLPLDDITVLQAMVRHHLLLPDVATRRDLADDATIQGVADAVGDLTVLELLAALTEADSLATGPSAWGPWKAELVAQLVERVAHVLRGGHVADVTDDFPTQELRQLMARRETLVRGDGAMLTVVSPDRPGLFSRVAGTLALNGLTVLGADAASDDDMAVSVFRVVGPGGGEVEWERVLGHLRLALAGRLALEARLSERARGYRRPKSSLAGAPRIRIDNNASPGATIIEVHAPDGMGVLYRITRAFADLDLDIRHAKVQTLGHEVVDSFYVRDQSGAKLTDPDHLRELERAVLQQLSLT